MAAAEAMASPSWPVYPPPPPRARPPPPPPPPPRPERVGSSSRGGRRRSPSPPGVPDGVIPPLHSFLSPGEGDRRQEGRRRRSRGDVKFVRDPGRDRRGKLGDSLPSILQDDDEDEEECSSEFSNSEDGDGSSEQSEDDDDMSDISDPDDNGSTLNESLIQLASGWQTQEKDVNVFIDELRDMLASQELREQNVDPELVAKHLTRKAGYKPKTTKTKRGTTTSTSHRGSTTSTSLRGSTTSKSLRGSTTSKSSGGHSGRRNSNSCSNSNCNTNGNSFNSSNSNKQRKSNNMNSIMDILQNTGDLISDADNMIDALDLPGGDDENLVDSLRDVLSFSKAFRESDLDPEKLARHLARKASMGTDKDESTEGNKSLNNCSSNNNSNSDNNRSNNSSGSNLNSRSKTSTNNKTSSKKKKKKEKKIKSLGKAPVSKGNNMESILDILNNTDALIHNADHIMLGALDESLREEEKDDGKRNDIEDVGVDATAENVKMDANSQKMEGLARHFERQRQRSSGTEHDSDDSDEFSSMNLDLSGRGRTQTSPNHPKPVLRQNHAPKSKGFLHSENNIATSGGDGDSDEEPIRRSATDGAKSDSRNDDAFPNASGGRASPARKVPPAPPPRPLKDYIRRKSAPVLRAHAEKETSAKPPIPRTSVPPRPPSRPRDGRNSHSSHATGDLPDGKGSNRSATPPAPQHLQSPKIGSPVRKTKLMAVGYPEKIMNDLDPGSPVKKHSKGPLDASIKSANTCGSSLGNASPSSREDSVLVMAARLERLESIGEPPYLEGAVGADYYFKIVRGEKGEGVGPAKGCADAPDNGGNEKGSKRLGLSSQCEPKESEMSPHKYVSKNDGKRSNIAEETSRGDGGKRDFKRIDSILAMADRLDKGKDLEEPSIIEGAGDPQYWKDLRGKPRHRRHMRGSGQAINTPQCKSEARSTSRSKKKELPSAQRKIFHENRKQKRIQEKILEQMDRHQHVSHGNPALAIEGPDLAGGRSMVTGQSRQRQQQKRSSTPQRIAGLLSDDKRSIYSDGGDRRQHQRRQQERHSSQTKPRLFDRLKRGTMKSRERRRNAPALPPSQASCGSHRSLRSDSGSRSIRSSRSGRSTASKRSAASERSARSERSATSNRSERSDKGARSVRSFKSHKSAASKKSTSSRFLRMARSLRRSSSVPRRRAKQRQLSDDRPSNRLKSIKRRDNLPPSAGPNRLESDSASRSVRSGRSNVTPISVTSASMLSAEASLAEHQSGGIPLTVGDVSGTISADEDDFSSCDSSLSYFSDDDDEPDSGFDDDCDSDAERSSDVQFATVAAAVQHLNKQNKLERFASAAKNGLRRKIQPRRSSSQIDD